MIDVNAAIYNWLSTDPTISALVAGRIFGGLLPQDYNADTDGPAISFRVRGGGSDAEVPLIRPSVQLETWAGPYQFEQAREVYRAVYDLMHGRNNIATADGYILSCVEEVQGQDMVDPETNWANVVSYWKFIMRAS